jgi:aminopeptidase-like protein
MRKVQGTDLSYPFLTVAGNDEKVFDSPGVGIPSISLMRVDQEDRLKQLRQLRQGGEYKSALPYPEYHSDFDNLKTVNFENVAQTVDCLYELCLVLERDFIPVREFKGPVFLSKYDLWIDWRIDSKMNEKMMRLLYYLEGDRTVFQIAEELELDFDSLVDMLGKFYDKGLIRKGRIPIGFDR